MTIVAIGGCHGQYTEFDQAALRHRRPDITWLFPIASKFERSAPDLWGFDFDDLGQDMATDVARWLVEGGVAEFDPALAIVSELAHV